MPRKSPINRSQKCTRPVLTSMVAAELQQQAAEADRKLAALRVEVERFRSHLGLQFNYGDGKQVKDWCSAWNISPVLKSGFP